MNSRNVLKNQPIFVRDVVFSGKESVGQRENQEDYSLFRTLGGGSELLAVIADGMGGHASGEVASKKAVTSFNETFASYPSTQVTAKLAAALQQANAEISQATKELPALEGMGCTLIGACFSSEGLDWISVGDSLLLLIRAGKLQRLNADHSMMALINDSVRSGKMSDAEAKNYPYKNALRSAVTGGEISLIDSPGQPITLRQGDIVVLATDGLLTLSEEEILNEVIRYKTVGADQIATNLVKAVEHKKKQKQDNTTVQVVVVPSSIAKRDKLKLIWVVVALGAILVACAAGLLLLKNGDISFAASVENAFRPSENIRPQPTAVPAEKELVQQPDVTEPRTTKDGKKNDSNPTIKSKKAEKSDIKTTSESLATKDEPKAAIVEKAPVASAVSEDK